MLVIILLVIAAICFAAAAIGVPSKINLVALGLFFWVLATLLPALLR